MCVPKTSAFTIFMQLIFHFTSTTFWAALAAPVGAAGRGAPVVCLLLLVLAMQLLLCHQLSHPFFKSFPPSPVVPHP